MVLFLSGAMLSGCSSDDTAAVSITQDFEGLRFIVNVDNGNEVTRGTTGKGGWTIGDRIVVAIDGSNMNLCNLVYRGDGEWNVTRQDGNTSFASEAGKLAAVHADRLSAGSDGITTEGDILYTQDGTYTRHDNVVSISLRMDKRPVSRIAVVGVDSTCWMDGMKIFDRLKSLVDARWTGDRHADSGTYKEVYGDTCVFYGRLDPDADGNTAVRLVNRNGAVYSRTYGAKSVSAGEYVIISGPESSEGGQWTSHVPVTGVTARNASVSLLVDDTGNVSDWYSLNPAKPTDTNVTVTSSNPVVLTIENGTYKAVSSGHANVTVTTEDGGFSCTIGVDVVSILDLVTFNMTGISTNVSGSGVYYGRQFTITNSSDFDIYVTELDGAVSGGQILVKAHSSVDVWNYYRVNGYTKSIKLVFTCNGKTYEKSGMFEV